MWPLCEVNRAVWLLLAVSLAVLGCHRQDESANAPRRPTVKKRASAAGPSGPGTLRATRFGTAPAGTFGPYLGVSPTASVAVWVQQDDDGSHWYTVPLRGLAAADEEPPEPRRIAEAPEDVGLVAVRPATTRNGDDVFVVLASSADAEGTRLDVLSVGEEGELYGGPVPLARDLDPLVWLQVASTSAGDLALWAVRGENTATLYAQPLGDDTHPEAAASQILDNAVAWQTLSLGDSLALGAVVQKGPGDPEREGSTGADVMLYFVDADGQAALGATLTNTGTAENDLDMVRLKDNLLLAWSDHESVQGRATLAVVDPRGKVLQAAHAPIPALGDQAVIKLLPTPDAKRAYLAFDELSDAHDDGRAVRVVPLDAEGRLGKRGGVFHFTGEGVPELVATEHGVSALTLARPCPRETPCNTPPVATYVALDERFEPVAAEPLRLDALEAGYAPLAWGLSCDELGCFALAAEATSPAALWVVDLEAQSNAWQPAALAYEIPPPPRIRSTSTLAATEELSDVALAPVAGGHLVAWLTYFDPSTPYERPTKPAPDGRMAPVRAVLEVQPLQGNSKSTVVSYRARSLGGVALVPQGKNAQRALLVWSALDSGQPQVFTTLLDAHGNKVTQKMLTKAQGEVNEVAAVYVGDGWVVAWVDERLGYPEVYVTKLDHNLVRVAPDTRLSQSPGSATGVALLALPDSVIVVRADARGHEAGRADIYLSEVSKKDVSLIGTEVRLTSNTTHSHSPALARLGDQVIVSWLESKPGKTAGSFTGSVSLGVYDPGNGHMASVAQLTGVEEVAPTSVSLECGIHECHVMMLVETAGNAEFHGFRWTPGETPDIVRVLRLEGRPTDIVKPALEGDLIVFADATRTGKGRVRKGVIDWK